ncbi:hypothetical protein J1P26_20710 [Neobacillus sp. MM2021_6]|uniref:hypothetical protein n=1 Tax=Bacillaceae TaxID=186817 RepID=UPI00140C1C25|nr:MULTISPECIES: hypothetical protein [Bacillaceae]MBO0962132.1 hypothetical protein [Neobacillus sp. MM2021_6]NHC20967.1 hypothetical protein [Bacillus sp. MM2020_4]
MKKWGPIIIAITIIGGMSIGLYIGNLLVPDLPAGTIAVGIGGTIAGVSIVLGIEQVRKRRKANNVPDVDERTWLNIKNFYAISLYFVLIGSMLLLCILFAFGISSIELGALSIYLLLIFMLIVVGTHIVKRQ